MARRTLIRVYKVFLVVVFEIIQYLIKIHDNRNEDTRASKATNNYNTNECECNHPFKTHF